MSYFPRPPLWQEALIAVGMTVALVGLACVIVWRILRAIWFALV